VKRYSRNRANPFPTPHSF